MSIEKDFVPYQESQELKELGFNEPCFGYRDGVGHLMIKEMPHCAISAPTFSQAFRFFREKYQIDSWIFPNLNGLYSVSIVRRGVGVGEISEYPIYPKAELACLRKLIEIVKQKQ